MCPGLSGWTFLVNVSLKLFATSGMCLLCTSKWPSPVIHGCLRASDALYLIVNGKVMMHYDALWLQCKVKLSESLEGRTSAYIYVIIFTYRHFIDKIRNNVNLLTGSGSRILLMRSCASELTSFRFRLKRICRPLLEVKNHVKTSCWCCRFLCKIYIL